MMASAISFSRYELALCRVIAIVATKAVALVTERGKWPIRFLASHAHGCAAHSAIGGTGTGSRYLSGFERSHARLEFCQSLWQTHKTFPNRYLLQELRDV